MEWKPHSSLVPNKLVFLQFADTPNVVVIGYVNADGICQWPENVGGRQPDGWQDLHVAARVMSEQRL